jgi:hypothetical protein
MSAPPPDPPPDPNTNPTRPITKSRRSRPQSARPDTAASGISILPDQQFFPEGEDFDEEEDFDDEEPEEEDVFAFARPKTSAAPTGAFSDYTTSAPATGILPTTAGTYISRSTFSRPTQARNVSDGKGSESGNDWVNPEMMQSPGFVDVGGHVPELVYDKENPPPMSGVNNPNNSSFAWMKKLQDQEKSRARPVSSSSFLSRLHRRGQTAGTDMTGTTELTQTSDEGETRFGTDSYSTSGAGTTKSSKPRRTRSSAPLIPSTAGTGITGISTISGTTSRGMSRGSIGLTEMSGEQTVPDGKTTWGDGMMPPVFKENSENGSVGVDINLTEEDSPYPEVRASVSNIDDTEMPGELDPHDTAND